MVVHVDADGALIPDHPPWFGKTCIRPRGKLSYEDAQAVIECGGADAAAPSAAAVEAVAGAAEMMEESQQVASSVLMLNQIAKQLRRAREVSAPPGDPILWTRV